MDQIVSNNPPADLNQPPLLETPAPKGRPVTLPFFLVFLLLFAIITSVGLYTYMLGIKHAKEKEASTNLSLVYPTPTPAPFGLTQDDLKNLSDKVFFTYSNGTGITVKMGNSAAKVKDLGNVNMPTTRPDKFIDTYLARLSPDKQSVAFFVPNTTESNLIVENLTTQKQKQIFLNTNKNNLGALSWLSDNTTLIYTINPSSLTVSPTNRTLYLYDTIKDTESKIDLNSVSSSISALTKFHFYPDPGARKIYILEEAMLCSPGPCYANYFEVDDTTHTVKLVPEMESLLQQYEGTHTYSSIWHEFLVTNASIEDAIPEIKPQGNILSLDPRTHKVKTLLHEDGMIFRNPSRIDTDHVLFTKYKKQTSPSEKVDENWYTYAFSSNSYKKLFPVDPTIYLKGYSIHKALMLIGDNSEFEGRELRFYKIDDTYTDILQRTGVTTNITLLD